MARLVSLVGCPHDPTLPIAARLAENGEAHPGALPALESFAALRESIAVAEPDAIVMVGSDHLNQWFFDNMAPFMIGKATRLRGPFDGEVNAWGLQRCDRPIEGDLARHLLRDGLGRGVDFAFSDAFTADHSFTIPLDFLSPRDDIPVVPVFINLLAPPVPPGWRYRQVGEVLRKSIESFGEARRVAMIVTGHMTNSVGGPGMLRNQSEPETEWDRETWSLIEQNDIDAVTRRAVWDQLYAQGNGTPGFLAYVLAFGAACGAPADYARLVATTAQPACAFLGWSETSLNGGAA